MASKQSAENGENMGRSKRRVSHCTDRITIKTLTVFPTATFRTGSLSTVAAAVSAVAVTTTPTDRW